MKFTPNVAHSTWGKGAEGIFNFMSFTLLSLNKKHLKKNPSLYLPHTNRQKLDNGVRDRRCEFKLITANIRFMPSKICIWADTEIKKKYDKKLM